MDLQTRRFNQLTNKMKKYVYLVTDRNRNSLHVGVSSDLFKTLQFYRQMPNLFFDAGQQLTRLVYFEELNSEETARQRFKVLSAFTRLQKERIVRGVNPDWVDLSIGLTLEKTMHSPVRQSPSITAFL